MNGMPEVIDRAAYKRECNELLRSARISPRAFIALYLALSLLLDLISGLAADGGLLSVFVIVLTWMMAVVLSAGVTLYCLDIRQGVHSGCLTLFDGFAFAGKLVGLALLQSLLVSLWSLLFVIPGVIASFRYSFAVFNLCENPELGILEALELSKRQTQGYKLQLLTLHLSYLGWIILTSLPEMLYTSWQISQLDPVLLAMDPYAALPVIPLHLVLAFGVWALLIRLFYLAQYRCVQLAYYDTAKRTSGTDPRRIQREWEDDSMY